MKLIQKIFSVTNQDVYKVWTILGVKIKCRNRYKTLEFLTKKMSDKIIKCLNSQNSDRRTLVSECRHIDSSINSLKSVLGVPNKPKVVDKSKDLECINISEQTELDENTKCPYCSSSKIYPIRDYSMQALINEYINTYNFNPYSDIYNDLTLEKMHCSNCGLEFYNYKIPDSPLLYEKLLATGRYTYPKYKWEYNQAINLIVKYDLKRVLDIGCGEGNFLDKIKNLVDYSLGSEFNQTAISRCREKGLNVTSKPLNSITEKFDFICMFQILEHISSPKQFIEEVLNLLEPGGLLFIATPNPYGAWCSSTKPSVLNLPPHHCLDVTKEFYFNLPKDFSIELLDYMQDEVGYGLYINRVLPASVKIPDHRYISYLLEKDSLVGHNHGVLYRKCT